MCLGSLSSLHDSGEAKFYALFCTAQIPAQTIDDFLAASDYGKLSINLWFLIHKHEPKFADKPTNYPLSSGDFITTFINSTISDLGAFCREHFDPEKSSTPYISSDELAVMNARILEDNTIMIVKWELWSEMIDLDATDNLDADEKYEDKKGWQTIRVPANGAAEFMHGVTETLVQEFKEQLKPGDQGVLRLKRWE